MDALGGEPLGQVEVALGGKRAVTDTAGRFEVADLDAGDYDLSATTVGYRLEKRTLHLGADDVQQLEIAFRYGTNLWTSFPEYLTRLAEVCRDELKREVRELKTKFIRTYLGPDLEGTLRRELSDTWGCPIYDTYGTHEMGTCGFDCRVDCRSWRCADRRYSDVFNGPRLPALLHAVD